MKIQNDGQGLTTGAADSLGRTADQPPSAAKGAPVASQGDQLSLSSEARLMQSLAQAAAEPPAIRQDVVDRMRALLDRGQLGADPSALADAIIDDWTNLS